MIRRLVLAAALSLGLAPTAAADFAQGAAAFETGDYATAYREFHALAQQDHADAQFALAQMYRFGAGVPQDDAEAFAWYRRAAEGGHAEAQTVLGFLYAYGVGTAPDYFQAYFWFSLAATRANPVAETNRDKMARSLGAAARAEADRLVAERRRQAKALRREPAPAPAASPSAEPEAPAAAAEAAPDAPIGPAATLEAEAAEATEARGEPAPAAPPPAASPDAFRLQLGAFRVAENAPAEWRRLQRAEADLLGDLQHRVRRLDLGDRGMLHLLRVGPLADAEAAEALCGALAERGVDCLVVTP